MAFENSSDFSGEIYAALAQGSDITTLESYEGGQDYGCDKEERKDNCKKEKNCNENSCDYLEKKKKWVFGLKKKAASLHERLANKCLESPIYFENNGDIHTVPDYLGCMTKGIKHDKKGGVDKVEYQKLLDYCAGDASKLAELKMGGKLKTMNPSSIYTVDSIGMPKESFWLPASPSIKSLSGAADLIEVYAMALARDIPFSEWKESNVIQWLAKGLSQLSEYWGPKKCGEVTADNIFRGETKGDLIGWYVSQFLYLDVKQGNQKYDQKIFVYLPGQDYLIDYETAKKAQEGYYGVEPTPVLEKKRYIITLRDGASYIHNDYPGQCAQAAALILLSLGCPITPQPKSSNELYINDLSIVDLNDLIFRAAKLSMAAAWFQKYNQLKLRPEAYALLVEEAKRTGCNPCDLPDELLNHPILNKIKARYGSYCLPQAYTEGSPTHPSYPSGHATWAGATITIVKAFFDGDFEIDAYGPNCDGSKLVPLGYKVKVNDELDKLASNAGTFRNVAGIHYRSDTLGIYLGEAVAIELLEEAVQRYGYPVKFEFKARNGEKVVINNFAKFKDC